MWCPKVQSRRSIDKYTLFLQQWKRIIFMDYTAASDNAKLYCFLIPLILCLVATVGFRSCMDLPVISRISQLSVNFCRLLRDPSSNKIFDPRRAGAQSSLICLFIIRARRSSAAVNLGPMPPKAAKGGGRVLLEGTWSSCKIWSEHGWL